MSIRQRPMLTAEELVQYRSRVEKILPSRGSKEFNPTGSWLESKQIQSALDERKDLLQEERVEKICMLAEAVWDEELVLARVTRKVGRHFEIFGHEVNRVLFLYPEEALFLIENNHLELLYDGVAMSIQQGYSTLLSPNTDCTLDEYRVYSQLVRQGYRMLRHSSQRKITRYERMIGLHQYIQPAREKRTRKEDTQKEVNSKSGEDSDNDMGSVDTSVKSEVKVGTECSSVVKSEDREYHHTGEGKSGDCLLSPVKNEDRDSCHIPVVKSESSKDARISMVKTEKRENICDPAIKDEGSGRMNVDIKPEVEMSDVPDDSDNPTLGKRVMPSKKHSRHLQLDIEEINLSDSEEMSSHNHWQLRSSTVECIEIMDCKTESEVEIIDKDEDGDNDSIISSSIQNIESKRTNSGTDINGSDKNDLCVTSTNSESINTADDDNVKANLGQQVCDSSVVDVSFESNKNISACSMSTTNSENFHVQKQSRNIQEITIDSTSPEVMRDSIGAKHSTMFSNSDKCNSSPSEEKPSSAGVCRIRWYVKREPKFARLSDTSTSLNEGTKCGTATVDTPASCDQRSESHNSKSNIDCSENAAIKKDDDDADIVNNENSSKETNMKLCQSSEACDVIDENTKKELIEVLDITDDNSGGKVKIAQDQQSSKDSDDIDDQICSKIAHLKQEDRLSEDLDATGDGRCPLKAHVNESTKVIEDFNVGNDGKPALSNLESSQPVKIFAVADNENSVMKAHGKQACSVEIVDVNDENSLTKEIMNKDQCPKVYDISDDDDDDDVCVKEEDEVSEIYDVTDDEDAVNTKRKVDTPEIIDVSDDEDPCRKRNVKGEDETPEVLDISDDSVSKSDIEDGSQISEVMDVTDDEDMKPVIDLENDCNAINGPDHCDEKDRVNDDRYSPAPINIGKEYCPSTVVYIPSRNTDLQPQSRDKEDFISLKTEDTHLESFPISNLKRKYQADDDCRDLDKRLHRSDSQWVSPNHIVVDLSDDENRENVDQNNINTEDLEERLPTSGNSVIKQEAASNITKIEEELSKFYEEIEEIDLEEEKKEVSEDRWAILDSFPNAYGQLVLNMAVPPARLLPRNVCPSKSHYLIPVTRRISPPVQNYRSRYSPNYRNNWRGRHRNHSHDRSRNHQRNSVRRNFEYRGMNESNSERHTRFGHQNMNEANLDNHRQLQHLGINESNPERQHFENHGMTSMFSDHRTFEYQENGANSGVRGQFDPQRINEANIGHRRRLEHHEFSLTDSDHRRYPGQQRLNQTNPELREYLEHQEINQTNPEHGRHIVHQGMNQRNSEQRRHLECEGINRANPEHRRHIELQGGNKTSSEHRGHLQGMNQLTPDRRKSLEHQGVYQTTPESGRALEHQRMIQIASGHRRQPEHRRHFERRGINQATPELRKPPDFQGMNRASPDHRSLPGHRGINQTNLELGSRNQGHEEMNVVSPGQWARNVAPSWSNTEVSFDYHHQTPALHAAQVAYNLINQHFSPQVLFPTMLPSSQSVWLGPQLPQTWLHGQRVLDRQPQELRPQAPFPLNVTWGGEDNCERNRNAFMDTDERQLPQQRFTRKYDCGRGYSNLVGNRPQCPGRSQNSFMKMKFKLPRYFAPPRKLQRLMENITYGDDDALPSEDGTATVSSSLADDVPRSSPESSDDEDVESLVKPEDCTTIGNILSRLQIIKSTNFGNINTLSEASDVVVKYDLYLPDTVFRKSNPSLPDFRLIILGFRQIFPSPGKMAALQQEYHDDVPFLLAIVLPDAITFFQYSVVTLPVLDACSLND